MSETETEELPEKPKQKLLAHPAVPYVMPFLVWIAFMLVDGIHEHAVYATYPLKTFIVGGIIVYFWRRYPAMKCKFPLQSIGIGILAFVVWVGLFDYLYYYGIDKESDGFKPHIFESNDIQLGLIIFRILGSALVVPILEEVLWRGFVQRFIIKEDFENVKLGTYTHASFWITTAAFVSVHNAIGVAVLVGILFGWWFVRTKTLGDVILAHGVTNLLLGIYVVYTQKWYFW